MPSRASAAALPSATWTASNSITGTTGVSYTFSLMPATTAALTSVVITLPAVTGSSPAIGSVTPSSLIGSGGALSSSVAGGIQTLTYAFTAATVQAGRVLSIQVSGMKNPASGATPSAAVSTYNGPATGTPVDTGSASFTFTTSQLTGVSMTSTSAAVGTAGVSYTYNFTIGLGLTINQVTLTVPPGTSGTPAIGSFTPAGLISGTATIALSGNTLTISTTSVGISLGTAYSVQVNGLTNTPTAGSYVPEVAVAGVAAVLGNVAYSGVGSPLTFPAGLWVGASPTLSWTGSLNGRNQALADTAGADQLMTVNDQTNSAAGWRVTASVTNFVNSAAAYTLPASGVLGVTGSTSGLFTSVPPAAACSGSAACTVPAISALTYPVIINSAASSPAAATVYNAQAGTGVGLMTLGGSTAANPVGWWVNVPALAAAGTYNSTITVTVSTGP